MLGDSKSLIFTNKHTPLTCDCFHTHSKAQSQKVKDLECNPIWVDKTIFWQDTITINTETHGPYHEQLILKRTNASTSLNTVLCLKIFLLSWKFIWKTVNLQLKYHPLKKLEQDLLDRVVLSSIKLLHLHHLTVQFSIEQHVPKHCGKCSIYLGRLKMAVTFPKT